MGIIDGTCVKKESSVVLSQQWERCNVILLRWILGSLTQELYVGQVYSEIAFEVWTGLKETYAKMDGEESHRRLHPCSSGNNKSQPAAFVVKTNNNTKNFNSRVNTNNNNNTNRGPNPNLICKNCGLIGHNVDIFNGNSKANQYVPSTSGSLSSSFLVPFKLRLIKSANEFDVLNEFEVHSLKFFDTQRPKRPYDEEGGTPNMESNGRVASDECDITVDDEAATFATQIRENIPSEGNVHNNQNGEDPTNILETSLVLRRSSRQRNMPSELNDFIVGSSVRYGFEKYALHRNNSYVLAHLPPGRKVKGCKWIWKIKYKASGEAVRYKARLMAKGYSQIEGIDYDETFSHVVRMVTVRFIIALSIQNNLPLYQLDVNNAFLYGDLNEDIYMELPPGYYDKNETKVYKLVKSLYGLKQAPMQWNEKLTTILFENEFVQSKNDYYLYVKSNNGVFIAILMYVDDIVVTRNNEHEIDKFKKFLSSKFMIKDIGLLKYFLGIKVVNFLKDLEVDGLLPDYDSSSAIQIAANP
ncbi:putative RNA-directed DNA polymerase [Tanacetum coccineum]